MSYKKTLNDNLLCQFRKLDASDFASYIIENKNDIRYFQGNKLGLVTINDRNSTIPRFGTPFIIKHESKILTHETDYVVVDVRGLRPSEAETMSLLAMHTLVWESSYTNEDFSGYTLLPLIAYTRWQSIMISQRFSLSYDEQSKVAIYCALFYLLQSRSVEELFEGNKAAGTVQKLMQATNLPATTITAALDLMDTDKDALLRGDNKAPNIHNLAAKLKEVSPRLNAILDWTVLLNVSSNSFMGSRGSVICNLAAEYPPAMVTLLISVLTDNSYQRSSVSKLLKEQILDGKYRSLGKDFIRTYKATFDEYYK